jgi:membrane protease YdiL (CAAX protease family)
MLTNPNAKPFEKLFGKSTPAKAAGAAFSVVSVMLIATSIILAILMAGVTLMQGGTENPDWFVYLAYILPQVSFAFAVCFALAYQGIPVKSAIKSQKCHPKYFLVAIILQAGLMCLAEVNTWFLSLLGEIGYQDAGIPIPSLDGFGVVGVLFVIGVLPAVFEEFFFRGVFLNGVRSFKVWSAVLLCGAFFALYHQNPAQTIYQFIVGSAFALVAIRSGSVFPTVLSHFLNNATIILLTKFGISSFSPTTLWIMLPICAVCLIGSLVYLIFIDKNKPEQSLETGEKQNLFKYASAGIAVCGVAWLITLMSGM